MYLAIFYQRNHQESIQTTVRKAKYSNDLLRDNKPIVSLSLLIKIFHIKGNITCQSSTRDQKIKKKYSNLNFIKWKVHQVHQLSINFYKIEDKQ